ADEDDAAVDHVVPDYEDLAGRLELSDVDDVEGLVEEHLLTHLEELALDVRLGIDAELPVAGEDVHRAVGVHLEDGPEVVRRLGELLDLFAENAELLTGLFEQLGDLVV